MHICTVRMRGWARPTNMILRSNTTYIHQRMGLALYSQVCIEVNRNRCGVVPHPPALLGRPESLSRSSRFRCRSNPSGSCFILPFFSPPRFPLLAAVSLPNYLLHNTVYLAGPEKRTSHLQFFPLFRTSKRKRQKTHKLRRGDEGGVNSLVRVSEDMLCWCQTKNRIQIATVAVWGVLEDVGRDLQ